MRTKWKIATYFAAIGILLCCGGVIYADTQGGGQGGGGASCSGTQKSNSSSSACWKNGLAWVYFKIINLDAAPKAVPPNSPSGKEEVFFQYPSGSNDHGYTTIVGCNDGFWLFGINIYEKHEDQDHAYAIPNVWRSPLYKGVDFRYTGDYKTSIIGAVAPGGDLGNGKRGANYVIENGTPVWRGTGNQQGNERDDTLTDSDLGFQLKGKNGVAFAETDSYGTMESVYNDYLAAAAANTTLNKYDEDGVYSGTGDANDDGFLKSPWFCYSKESTSVYNVRVKATIIDGNNRQTHTTEWGNYSFNEHPQTGKTSAMYAAGKEYPSIEYTTTSNSVVVGFEDAVKSQLAKGTKHSVNLPFTQNGIKLNDSQLVVGSSSRTVDISTGDAIGKESVKEGKDAGYREYITVSLEPGETKKLCHSAQVDNYYSTSTKAFHSSGSFGDYSSYYDPIKAQDCVVVTRLSVTTSSHGDHEITITGSSGESLTRADVYTTPLVVSGAGYTTAYKRDIHYNINTATDPGDVQVEISYSSTRGCKPQAPPYPANYNGSGRMCGVSDTRSISGSKSGTYNAGSSISGKIFYGQQIDFEETLSWTIKYRERYYKEVYLKDEDGNVKLDDSGNPIKDDAKSGYVWDDWQNAGGGSSTVGAPIKRVVGKCTKTSGTYTFDYENGEDIVEFAVQNYSLSGSSSAWNQITVNAGNSPAERRKSKDILARPGDLVRYRTNICAGGSYVNAVNTRGLTASFNYSTDTAAYVYKNSSTLVREAPGTVSNGKTKTWVTRTTNRISNYLFGNTVGDYDSSQKKTTPKNVTYNNSSNLFSDSVWNKRLFSPSEETAVYNKTACGALNNAIGSSTSGYYRVAGKQQSSGCGNRVNTLDVGTYIEQKIDYSGIHGSNLNANYRDGWLIARIAVPYNYILKPTIDNGQVSDSDPNHSNPAGTYANSYNNAPIGSEFTMKIGISTLPRKNTGVSTDNSKGVYATLTKPTKLKVERYVLKKDGTKKYIDNNGTQYASNPSGGTHTEENFVFNSDSDLKGQTDYPTFENVNWLNNGMATVTVPDDAEVGDHICIAASVYPVDSHDLPSIEGDQSVNGANGPNGDPYRALTKTSGLSETASSNWRRTESCSPISKRPTVSVEGSNTYSATKIDTNRYRRYVWGDSYKTRYIFGSWGEYGVFGKVVVKGDLDNDAGSFFASGTGLGYRVDYPNTDTLGSASSKTAIVNNTRPDNGEVAKNNNVTYCTLSTQTFANVNCESGDIGFKAKSGGGYYTIGDVSANQFYARLRERYYTSSQITNPGLPRLSVKNGNNTQDYLMFSKMTGRKDDTKSDKSATYFVHANNQHTEKLVIDEDYKFDTDTVIQADEIVINGNITRSHDDNYTDLEGLSGAVIIADTIKFTNRPTRIDAIILAKDINTCAFDSGTFMSGVANELSVDGLRGKDVTASNCGTELRFNAPVIVSGKLTLARTYGAGPANHQSSTHESGASQRAEIFDLNMATYLWSYKQMSRYSQAVTTYSREIPSRY